MFAGAEAPACAFALKLPAGLAAPAAATTTAAVAAKSTAAAPAKPALGLGPGLVDRQAAAAHLELIKLGGRFRGLLVGRHLDECEPPGTARRGVAHDTDRLYGSCLAEELLEFRFSRAIREVADVKPSTHTLSSLYKRRLHH
jgi:hypothetical protein